MTGLRFYHPDHDREALTTLVRRCHPARRERRPFWWQVVPTMVLGARGELVAYLQFSLTPGTLYQYDLGVDPAHQGRGLGRALFAERLRMGANLGATRAVGATAPDNRAMLALFAEARFEVAATLPGHYQDSVPPGDAVLWASTPASFEWARLQTLDAAA